MVCKGPPLHHTAPALIHS